MAHTEARAWWADVEHLRDVYDRTDEARRRAELADRAADRSREDPHVEAESGRTAAGPRRRQHAAGAPIPARRTVEIRGRTVPAPAVPRSADGDRTRRPARPPIERVGPRPDRLAMWALLMGVVLILIAVATADASALAR
ncbi:MAG TPA: hypothetical protein VG474_07285 [Solirubrobacteraceae bacterium]|nr:hypothetical protein [Solirubrobacteraceae bacterium]